MQYAIMLPKGATKTAVEDKFHTGNIASSEPQFAKRYDTIDHANEGRSNLNPLWRCKAQIVGVADRVVVLDAC